MKFNKTLESIKVYEAGKPIELVVREFGIKDDEIVKLASNENPKGCSLKVQEAVSEIVPKMSLYPDDSMMKLKEGLSKHFSIAQNEVIIGAGSDQVIEFAIHAKAFNQATILMNSVTFAMYEVYAAHVGANIVRTESREHDLKEFYTLYKEHKPSIIFICTPNNPTGDAIKREELIAFLDKIDSDTLVVVDGAYMEYGAYKDEAYALTPSLLIEKYDNVLYLGTFSKAYGLGGMRTGYGIAQEGIINALYKLRPPFNITTLSLEAASIAIEDQAFVQDSMLLNANEMKRYERFAKENSIEFIESYTNFITLLLKSPRNSSDIASALLRKGMIVRDLSGYGLNAIRVTIGTEKQNNRFFELFSEILKG